MTVTAAQVLAVLGINPATLRKWVERGKVRRYGRDAYDVDDVAAEVLRRARGRS
jgi:predicted site-specific integrase-resolvase